MAVTMVMVVAVLIVSMAVLAMRVAMVMRGLRHVEVVADRANKCDVELLHEHIDSAKAGLFQPFEVVEQS
jgi:hypothetical protein